MRHTPYYEKAKKRAKRGYQPTLSLRELRKKSDSWYKKGGIVTPGRRKRKTIEYIVNKSYDALPKTLKEEIASEDKSYLVENLVQQIMVGGSKGVINPYQALLGYAEHQQNAKGRGTLRMVWQEFKVQSSEVYNHYNSYIYRLGHSAVNYYMDNATYSVDKNLIEVTVDLPHKVGGVSYDILYIEFDFSGGAIINAYMG